MLEANSIFHNCLFVSVVEMFVEARTVDPVEGTGQIERLTRVVLDMHGSKCQSASELEHNNQVSAPDQLYIGRYP